MFRRALMRIVPLIVAALIVTGCGSGGTAGPSTNDATQVPEAQGSEAQAPEAQEPEDQTPKVYTFGIKQIKKHGNVILDTSFEEMRSDGMDVGDIVTVVVKNKEYDVPVGTSFTDVDSGNMICRFDLEDDEVSLAFNMGSFAEATGIGEKHTISEDPGYKWDVKVTEVGLFLKEKEGYLEEYRARNLTRTDNREDYPDLTDAEFANFRAVSVSGIKDDILYRSSTPLDPAIGRSEYAMAATEAAGIRSIINLGDSEEQMKGFDAYQDSYYSRCPVVNPEMNYDFTTVEFAEDTKASISFIIGNDGPYLIHCKEGKDRTGILCAILECFAGTPYDEVCKDYMLTYRNFYNVKPEDTAYSIILKNNLEKALGGLFQIEDVETANLKERASEYLLSIGLSQEDLDTLSAKISEQ